MTLNIEPAPTAAEVEYVAMHMRERDFAEFSAATGHTDRRLLANLMVGRYARRQDVLVARDGAEPVVVAGFMELRPRVISLLFFATPRLSKVGVGVTRAARIAIDQCFADGAHRVECMTLAGYPQMHRWLILLGLLPEGPPQKNWGANREAFVPFARLQ